ncbi:hypothetical protein BDV27DRAFT_151834 [Aspergillus caelatus]|uniref:Ricin B lectin domain-containing protein n=1 Tax=Aspergillus caelatus TaxID=61420 RepID=A0A5N7AKW9_9EURO|nr:uncharacterized protein BDV27DRAFT_151834 [Aspergillus caelatus]KAE8370574.1 hypothetical protein BDV27DRAFT_151834 [Aspergillus caelatus]
MKTFLVLGALAALFQSTSCLEAGTYKIRPAGGVSTRVLTDTGEPNAPVKFDIARWEVLDLLGISTQTNTKFEISGQRWHFLGNGKYDNYGSTTDFDQFVITSGIGYNITCGNQVGSPCVSGDKPQFYSVRKTSFGTYQIVDNESGYFLRASGEDEVHLAAEDNSIQEEFFLDKLPIGEYVPRDDTT